MGGTTPYRKQLLFFMITEITVLIFVTTKFYLMEGLVLSRDISRLHIRVIR